MSRLWRRIRATVAVQSCAHCSLACGIDIDMESTRKAPHGRDGHVNPVPRS
jgi:hypothetical protein